MDVITAKTFLAAATAGSFAAAAENVNASPSTVTERIKQLEHLLRVRLFDRDRSGCRLTPAGRRLVDPARNLVRSWEVARATVGLPANFAQSIRIGGQYALWPSLLIPWLRQIRGEWRNIAFRAISAAPTQLNLELEEGGLDLAFLYEPIVRREVHVELLATDRLIMVTADPSRDWNTNYVRIGWGGRTTADLLDGIVEFSNPGLELDLGILSVDWLVASGMCGYVPERLVRRELEAGILQAVQHMPDLEFSPYVCWRTSLPEEIVAPMIMRAKSIMEE